MDKEKARQKILEAIDSGNVHIGEEQSKALSRISLGKKPNFTVTAARVEERGEDWILIAWETQSAGFGTLTIGKHNGEWMVDNEAMGIRFCREVFAKLDEPEPEFEKILNDRSTKWSCGYVPCSITRPAYITVQQSLGVGSCLFIKARTII